MLLTEEHFYPLQTPYTRVMLVAMKYKICKTHRYMDETTHSGGCLVVPCTIDSALTSYLCVLNRRLTKAADTQVLVLSDMVGDGCMPMNKWMSWIQKGEKGASVLL